MKLWIASDLHMEFGERAPDPPAEADMAVLAGDVCDDVWLADLSRMMPTVYVAGNHDFYKHAIPERKAELASIPNLYFLDDSSAEIGGVTFIGATLWTDYDVGNPSAINAARYGMNDHRHIKWRKQPWERFEPKHAIELHLSSVEYMITEFSRPPTNPIVVVTHHLPSVLSVDDKYAGDILNFAFFSDLDDVVKTSGAELWVHGHTHSNADYMLGDTRVLCNPRGYPRENPGFDPALIVEVGNG